jgi:16S rRNA (cytosine967-C5)-methyltransferase
MRNLQKLAAGALEEVLAGAALHQVLPRRLQQLETPGERGALQDIVYGSLRHLGRLDAWLETLLERPLTDPSWLAARGALTSWPTRAPAHAVMHNAVPAAGEGWRRGLANAVLRNFQRRRAELEKLADEQPRARWSHPDWWIAKLQAEHPAHWQGILEASQQHPPFTLRVNCRHGDVAGYLQRLTEAGLPAHQTGAEYPRRKAVRCTLPGFDAGDVSVQDAAQWAAPACWMRSQGEARCLMPAPPGSKTCHILERADVELTALDIDAQRLARVRNLTGCSSPPPVKAPTAQPRAVVGRPSLRPHPRRRALLRLRRGAPQPRHQVAAPPRRHRAICRAAGRDAGGALAAADPGWYIAVRHLLPLQ